MSNPRVYVRNLSWSTNDDSLRAFFEKVGPIVSAEVARNRDRSKGWAIVEFSDPADAQKAVDTTNGLDLDGRPIQLWLDEPKPAAAPVARAPPAQAAPRTERPPRADKPPRERAPRPPRAQQPADDGNVQVARRVYVGNLSWRTSWQDLKDHFKQIGNVVYSDVIREPETNRSKGFGIVEFEHQDDAARAIQEYNGTEMNGRLIYVRADKKDRELQPDSAAVAAQ